MALETAFRYLSTRLIRLREELSAVQLTVVEDVPEDNASALAEKMADHLADVLGLLEGAISEATDAQQAVAHPINMDRARQALWGMQDKYNRLSHKFALELVSYQRISQLEKLGRDRGRLWRDWAKITKEGFERCQQPIYEVSSALLQCWQELAERAGMNTVSVQTTTIGQQFTIPENGRAAHPGISNEADPYASAPGEGI